MGIAHRAGPGPAREPQRSVHLDHGQLGNLHLEASGHNALDKGENLSGSFLVDIGGETRRSGAAWDIGANEQSAGAAAKPNIVRWREVAPQ